MISNEHMPTTPDSQAPGDSLARRRQNVADAVATPAARWMLVHGFIAGFGFGGQGLEKAHGGLALGGDLGRCLITGQPKQRQRSRGSK